MGERVERSLSDIGARLAEAIERLNQAKQVFDQSVAMLETVQEELSELYISLEDLDVE